MLSTTEITSNTHTKATMAYIYEGVAGSLSPSDVIAVGGGCVVVVNRYRHSCPSCGLLHLLHDIVVTS